MSARIEQAVILAAGRGARLKWLTEHQPKPLMKVQGEYAIVHVIRRLVAQGVKDIAINVHYHGTQLMQALGDGSRYGARLYYSQEQALLDSGGGVRNAVACLPYSDAPLLVHNADILSDVDVQRLAALLAENDCALALVPNPAHHPDGDFVLQNASVYERTLQNASVYERTLQNTSVHEKNMQDGNVQEHGSLCHTFSGVSVWDMNVVRGWPQDIACSLVDKMRDAMRKQACAGLYHAGQWFDIGRPVDLMRARRRWDR